MRGFGQLICRPGALCGGLALALAGFGAVGAVAADGSLAAVDLRTCDKVAPVGTEAVPWFGWRPVDDARDALQKGYRIEVASSLAKLQAGAADVWDSGSVKSTQVNAVTYAGPPLATDTRYFWRVTLVDDQDLPGPTSAPATFDVGLLRNEDWTDANWVRRNSDEENDYTLYRRGFDLPAGTIARAVVYLSSCHKYELWVNGDLTGKGPAYHQPQFQYYNSYDVTAQLRPGQSNALAVFNRWWGAGQGRPKGARGLIARLVVHYADGRQVVIGSDGAWRQHRAEQWELGTPKRNRTNGVGYVEKIHADKAIEGWQEVGFDDSRWDPVTVIGPQPSAPWTGVLQTDLTRVIEEQHEAVAWTQLGENHYLVDFGRVRAGYPVVDFPAWDAPGEVTMRGGYTLEEDGRVSLRTAQKTDLGYVYVHDGRAAQFRPAEYLGMRYLEISNAPPGLTREQIHFVSRHYELNTAEGGPRAQFQSSNAMLDRVWDLMVQSIPVGTQEEFIDTPTREKGGFLGDAWSESVAAMIAMGDRAMTRRVLLEYLDSQDVFWPDGRLNDVYPYDGADDIPDYTQMYLVWVWDYYMETGDRAFLKENYDRLAKVAAYVLGCRNADTGLVHDLAGGQGPYLYGIIDWTKSMRYGYDMETTARTVINAYACVDTDIMARIARVLGRVADTERYASDAAVLRSALNGRLVDDRGIYTDGLKPDGTLSTHLSQQANMLPLAWGLVPESRCAAVLDHIKSLHMSSGMVTVRMLVEAIGESGDGDHLVELFTNETWDGWAKCLARGATCTWESWNAIDGNESLSHAWGAIGLVGHVRYILGVTPLEPQHARIRVRPLIFGDALTHASGRVPTDRGSVSVAWRRHEGDRFHLEVGLPDAMQAEIWVPCREGGAVTVDGRSVAFVRRDGDYLVLDAGPGAHVFESK